MSKYSLQTECLENIEAYSNEQFDAEMSVIESAIAIFNKTILMMELSNSDIDLPDCSLFMESTFFQELNEGENGSTNDNNQETTDQNSGETTNNTGNDTSSNTNNDTSNNSNTNTDAKNKKVTDDPKEYNKTHHFRKATKDGNLENIFVSIVLFIFRLIALPVKLLINYIKKKKNEKSTENAKNATPEEKKAAAEAIKKDEGSNKGNVKIENGQLTASATVTSGKDGQEQIVMNVDGEGNISANIDPAASVENIVHGTDAIVQQYSNAQNALTSDQPANLDIESIKQKDEAAKKAKAEQRQKETIEAYEGRRAQTLSALEKRLKELQQCETNLENCKKMFERPGALKGYNLQQVVNARKQDLENIKKIIQFINKKIQELGALDALSAEIFQVYEGYLTSAKETINTANNVVTADTNSLGQAQQAVSTGNAPTTGFHINPVIGGGSNNQGGGNPNGGQEQNNPANAG